MILDITIKSPKEPGDETPIEVLQEQIDKLSLVRTLKDAESTDFSLTFFVTAATPPLVRLLIELLNVPLPSKIDGSARKWDVCFFSSFYISEGTTEEQKWTPEEMHRLAETLATRTNNLEFMDSPNLLPDLLRAHRWEMASLAICCFSLLNAIDLFNLRNLLHVSTALKHLTLLVGVNAPEQLAGVVISARYLESLQLILSSEREETTNEKHQRFLSEIVVDEGGHSALARLLQDPHSQLKYLGLAFMDLKDDHFIAMFRFLLISRLEKLTVWCDIGYCGIMEVARFLPRINHLRRLSLFASRSLSAADKAECNAALVQGIMQNTSLEDCSFFRDDHQYLLFGYHLTLNRAGRKILSTCRPVPLGLWSYILERAGTTISYKGKGEHDNEKIYDNQRRAEAVYFFIQKIATMPHLTHKP